MADNPQSTSTQMDDVPVVNDGPTEQELLDAVMANSPIMDELNIPLPEKEEPEVDPAESEVEEDPESEEVVSEEEEVEETEEEEVEDEDGADEAPTQDAEAYSLDELDEFKVMVKIDGEETAVDIHELVKGFATEQSLSKKGRELGEARKALDTERDEKLGQLQTIAEASASLLGSAEQDAAKEYHALEAKIEEARKEGDTFTVSELKDKRETVQKKYWDARQKREGLINAVEEQRNQVQAQQWEAQVKHFQEEIPNLIPDFNEDVAQNIRAFALEEGINPDVLDTIVDPVIVKFVDDYRRLKQGINKGAAKRKAVPTKRAVPTKKATPAKKKAEDKAKMIKARAFKEDASQEDQMDFLRQYASNSLNKMK